MYTFSHKKKREYGEKIKPHFLIKGNVNRKKQVGKKTGLKLFV